ncbi:MAG: cobalamin-dependent protein [Candidatus Omnitrophota bacterium]|nr:cobalamin-dependent protein [Candidatus Omnitrophota bacterium]
MRKINIILIFTLIGVFLVQDISYGLRVPLIASNGILQTKFEAARAYSIARQNNSFMYQEAIKELNDIIISIHGRKFLDSFYQAIRVLTENSLLVDDAEDAMEAVQDSLRALKPGYSLKNDEYAKFLFDLLRRREALKIAIKDRFDGQGFIETMILPDLEGGYYVGKAGIEGQWEVEFMSKACIDLENKHIVNFIDSLSFIVGRIKERKTYVSGDISDVSTLQFGSVYVVDSLNDRQVGIQIIAESRKANIFVTVEFLKNSTPKEQRRLLRRFFKEWKKGDMVTYSGGLSLSEQLSIRDIEPYSGSPAVLFVNFTRTIGANVLKTALEEKGFKTEVMDYDFIKGISDIAGKEPRAICLSLSDTQHPRLIEGVIGKLRYNLPGSFIIAGGPCSMTPKIALSLLKDVDMFIRGEGEEALPRVLQIIGDTDRRTGLSNKQFEELRKIPGIFIRFGKRVLFSHLDHTNMVIYFNTLIVQQESDFGWNIRRGCPYKCNFCRVSMGRKYRPATLENMKKNMLLLFAAETAFSDATLGRIADILHADIKTLQGIRGLNYLPEGLHSIDRIDIIEIIKFIANELNLSEPSIKKEVAEMLTGLNIIDAREWDELAQILPQEVAIEKARAAILHLRLRRIEKLFNTGEDLLEHGLFKEYLPDSAYEARTILDQIPFSEEIDKRLNAIIGRVYGGDRISHWSGIKERYIDAEKLVQALDFLNEEFMPIDAELIQDMRTVMNSYIDSGKGIRGENFIGEDIKTYNDLRKKLTERYKYQETVRGIYAFGILEVIKYHWLKKVYEKDNNLYHYGLTLKQLGTNEDNTLAMDKSDISDFLQWVIEHGINRYLRFDLGQNSVGTLLKSRKPDVEFIGLMTKANATVGGLGTDGLTPRILRQNNKGYTFTQAMRLNAELNERGHNPSNNYIISTPDSSELDIVESFLMFILEPFLLRKKDFDSWPLDIRSDPGAKFTNEDIALHPEAYRGDKNILTNSGRSLALRDLRAQGLLDEFKKWWKEESGLESENLSVKRFLETKHPELVKQVVQRWQSSEETDEEIKALGDIFKEYEKEGLSIFETIEKIKQDMKKLMIYTYSEYLAYLKGEELYKPVERPIDSSV